MKLTSYFCAYLPVIVGCAASLCVACSDAKEETIPDGASGSSSGARSGTGGARNNTGGSSQGGRAGSAGASRGGTSASSGGSGGESSAGSGGSTAGSSPGGSGGVLSSGGSSAGSSGSGGSDAAGAAGSSSGEVGCSKLTLSFDASFGGGQDGNDDNTECSGTVGEFLSTLRFDLDTDIRYDFTVQSDVKPGQTGKFDTVITARSIDLFAGPWLSKTNQCSLDVTLNQKFSETVKLAGKITCNPKDLAQGNDNPEGPLGLKKWEFIGEFSLEK